ncbi:MAG: alpha/beta hydrolase [Bdellovibrionaceae bacterium]|nr:alpha/beta hydrolase [Pseudobdellovibrionaceae bacterium]
MTKSRNWVLLRGLIRGVYHWHQFPEKLAKAFPNDKIHMFDLPGNGRRNRDASPITIEGYTEDLRFLCRRLDRVHLIAISLGGMIALDWIAHHPGELERVFVMNTSLGDTGPFYKRLNYLSYPRIVKSLNADAPAVERLILDLTTNNLRVQDEVYEHFVDMARRYPTRRLNFLKQIVAASRTRWHPSIAEFKNIHLMASANDRLVHCDNTFYLGHQLGISPAVHPWAGHDITLDDPDFVVEQCLLKTHAD